MKLHLTLFSSLFLLAACTSAPTADVSDADAPCRCGTPMGDLEGCGHADCRAGRENPDNPDCVCGSLELTAEEK